MRPGSRGGQNQCRHSCQWQGSSPCAAFIPREPCSDQGNSRQRECCPGKRRGKAIEEREEGWDDRDAGGRVPNHRCSLRGRLGVRQRGPCVE